MQSKKGNIYQSEIIKRLWLAKIVHEDINEIMKTYKYLN